ncbi:MAG TPA: hypothetical protein VD794_04890 [Flavisolibacter sp.]|nr:hypothetical protein [Flavisolibacter sp.]
MFRIFTLLLFLICCTHVIGQQNKKFSYLVVQFNTGYDYSNSKDFFTISPEDKAFLEMNKLVHYNPKSNKGNTSVFFASKTDSTETMYNYFQSINEALLFLGEKGWELVSVNNTITSEGETRGRLFDSEVPYTKINAKPVFYFKKLLNN